MSGAAPANKRQAGLRNGARSVLGVGVDPTTYADAVDQIVGAAHSGSPLAVSALAVHGVMTGVQDDEHRHRLNDLDLVTPDGQPVRWALNLLYRSGLTDRVYGPRLMLETLLAAATHGLPIYLYGSTPEVLEPLQSNLVAKFPGLKIAGAQPSRFGMLDEDGKDEVAAQIRASGAKIVFVGLGCPRQEIFVWGMRERLSMPALAVGAAFDFHAGLAQEAPEWMQKRGLQWLHRLVRDPRRLWRRYLLLNPAFLARLFAQKLRLWRPEPRPVSVPRKDAPIPG